MQFDVLCLRFLMEAKTPVFFPPGKAANTLRGAFGWILQQEDPDAAAHLFAPKSDLGPSGLSDAPRPFVFRTSHLEGKHFPTGGRFFFGMNLFMQDPRAVERIVATFRNIEYAKFISWCRSVHTIHLGFIPQPVPQLRVRFVSPTELKGHNGQLLETPEFGVLMARIRDRISTLRSLYGKGALEMDFAAFGERASNVKMTRCDLSDVCAERTSSRTGQTHPLGGFVGVAEYQGDLGEFLPFLRAASYTGVGRQTVWGKGEIAVEC